jgi:hypothetical protein
MREIRPLRDENVRRKRLAAGLTLDKRILTWVIQRNVEPEQRRQIHTPGRVSAANSSR